jgi:hypothetical protein
MITPVKRRSTSLRSLSWRRASARQAQNTQKPQRTSFSLRTLRVLRLTSWLFLGIAGSVSAHDLERTQVSLTFARDGSFVLDVANDPSWLKLRLEEFPGSFADRVVLWVDGHEVRPTSVEYVAPTGARDVERPLGTHRLRGRLPLDAHTLRWYYGLVIDPYPLTIRRADGRVIVEEIGGDAWSRTIDVSGQFQTPPVNATVAGLVVVGLLLAPILIRLAFNTKDTKDTKEKPCTV